MSALGYEHFVRKAFGDVERGKDPAGLAEADIYNSLYSATYMNELKIGTGYAIAIYKSNYIEEKELRDPDDYEKMDKFLDDVLKANTGEEIGKIIEEYREFQKELDDLPNRF